MCIRDRSCARGACARTRWGRPCPASGGWGTAAWSCSRQTVSRPWWTSAPGWRRSLGCRP
eukprot:14959264-Alexandrium_andersonii.AAC.1